MRIAMYKGREYRIEYLGPTKYGRRARLSFLTARYKSFWVDAERVREIGSDEPAPVPVEPEPPYEDEFDTYRDEATAEQRAERIYAVDPFDIPF